MKKGVGVILVVVLLSVIVAAVPTGIPPPTEEVQRFTDFETDNVHILRIGNFSRAVVEEVGHLETNISIMQGQLAAIEAQLEELKKNDGTPVAQENTGLNEITAKLVAIESEITGLRKTPQKNDDASLSLVLNGIILLAIGALFLFIRQNVSGDEQQQAELHAQLHLKNAVRNALRRGVPVATVRQSFVEQGWNGSWVERAIDDEAGR